MRAVVARHALLASPHAPTTIGWFGEDIVDGIEDAADAVADVVTSVVDRIEDAAAIIGTILKTIAPIVAMFPGIGTAFSVALSAAASLALGTPIDEALIDTASAAIPGGIPRLGFDTAVNVTKDIAAGRNAWGSVLTGCRQAAQMAGGDRAVAAFDAALKIARGGGVTDAALDAARRQLAGPNGSTQVLAAFDAGVAIAKGESAQDVLLLVGRDYIAANGGPLALAAFDTGVALAQGQTLQDAGFAGLKAFVVGNDVATKALAFAEKMARAAHEGKNLVDVLVEDLWRELAPILGTVTPAQALAPLLSALHVTPSALAWGSQALADAWGYAEPVVRAAQAIMRDPAAPDAAALAKLARLAEQERQARVAAAIQAAIKGNTSSSTVAVTKAPLTFFGTTLVTAALRSDVAQAARRPVSAVAALGKTAQATPPASSPVIVSSAPIPPSPIVTTKPPTVRNGLASDLALGGVIGVAALTLLWWHRSG